MALIAAAVCPHPPLLVPSVGRGLDASVRAVAQAAVDRLVRTDPDLLVLVGADDGLVRYDPAAVGSFSPYGVDEQVPLACDESDERPASSVVPSLPLSLTVGAWLLRGTGWRGARTAVGVPDTTSPADAIDLGRELASSEDRVAMLCLGDASARRSEKAPGWWDDRAPGFDAHVAGAVGGADLEAIAEVDAGLARELLVAGRAAWQVLAGAAAGSAWDARLLYDDAPYGVGYLVADWTRAQQ